MALSVINKSTDNQKLYLPENCKLNRQVGQVFVFFLTAHVSFVRLYPIDNGREPIRNVNSGILLGLVGSRVLKMASFFLFFFFRFAGLTLIESAQHGPNLFSLE